MFQKGKKNPHSGGLNIMIVGCGKVGMTLVDRLSKEGHDISVVDKNAARLQSVTHMHDVYGVVGNGASIFPRAGPTRLVPFRNIVNANTVPTSTISSVIITVTRSSFTDIFQTRMIKKNAIPPVNIPIPVGMMLPQSARSCCGIKM